MRTTRPGSSPRPSRCAPAGIGVPERRTQWRRLGQGGARHARWARLRRPREFETCSHRTTRKTSRSSTWRATAPRPRGSARRSARAREEGQETGSGHARARGRAPSSSGATARCSVTPPAWARLSEDDDLKDGLLYGFPSRSSALGALGVIGTTGEVKETEAPKMANRHSECAHGARHAASDDPPASTASGSTTRTPGATSPRRRSCARSCTSTTAATLAAGWEIA